MFFGRVILLQLETISNKMSRHISFFQDFKKLLEKLVTFGCPIAIVGDFNLHLEKPGCPYTVKFNDYLQPFGLKQHVSTPTHNKGGTLDVFITRSDLPSPDIFVHAPSISDHSLIEGHLPVQPMTVFDLFSVCSWSKFDKKAFHQDLLTSELFSENCDLSGFTVEELFSEYDSTLRRLLDKHLPIRKVRKRIEPLTPWFDSDCIKAKRNKRRFERVSHRTGLIADRVEWVKAIRDMHALFSSKERAFWEAKVAAAASNSKKRWQILNKLMCKDFQSQIPDSATAEAFSKFFTQKVESVRSATEHAAPPTFSTCPKSCSFDTFQPLATDQVLVLIRTAPDKTSDLDPVPTWLVQEFAPIFAPFFARVFNDSLEKGYLPASQKKAIVYPGLKKSSLDPEELSNYRPISNLSFVSKLLEQAVHAQLLLYLNDNNLLPSVQSAYRQFFRRKLQFLG